MLLLKNIKELVTLQGAALKDGRKITEADLSVLKGQSLVADSKVRYIGPLKSLPKSLFKKIKKEISLKHHCVLPGLVECHTHSVFAGSRAAEFEKRIRGVSYQQIAAEGGGILSTVHKTREVSKKDLQQISQERIDAFVAQGVSTIEVKSGYGLDMKSEIKMLEVIQKLKGPQVISTFLGAHALPKEHKTMTSYLDHLKKEVLPLIRKKKLAQRIDIFVEKGFFEKEAALDYLKHAQAMGFALTLHADQLTLSGGTDLALALKAQSADHVIQIQSQQINKLSHSQVVSVLLPMADLYMKCAYPPARLLLDAGAKVALATDFNPGTSPSQDLALVGLLARLEMKMQLPEVITAYTYNAASALGLQKEKGFIEVNNDADFSCYENDWDQLFYSAGAMKAFKTISGGKIIN